MKESEEEVFTELTVEEELALQKSLEDVKPLTTSEYINLLGELDVTETYNDGKL